MNGHNGLLSARAARRDDGATLASNAPEGMARNQATASAADGARAQAAGLPGPGERIGQYELIRELGRGGMGAVFLARDTKLGRRVAIKFLHGQNPDLTARFILEARATARCHHENIIVIHDVGEHGSDPYMVLEYLEGSPLSKLLGKGHSLPPGRSYKHSSTCQHPGGAELRGACGGSPSPAQPGEARKWRCVSNRHGEAGPRSGVEPVSDQREVHTRESLQPGSSYPGVIPAW